LVILAAMFGWVVWDFFSPRRHIVVSAGIVYWHFVDAVWLFVFATYYLTPYLGFAR
jgi:heme/copper-type cytochrome/quinol oxidase subunit 3